MDLIVGLDEIAFIPHYMHQEMERFRPDMEAQC